MSEDKDKELAEQRRQLNECHELLQAAILLVAEYAEMSNDPEAITECAAFVERAAEVGANGPTDEEGAG